MKIGVIGAGNVGSALAERVLTSDLADVVLLDINEDLAKAKALDLMDCMPLVGRERHVVGVSDYKSLKDCRVATITAGFPRKPGMSREDLIQKNIQIIRPVVNNIKKVNPDLTLITVTNPLDIMTYVTYKEYNRPKNRVLGMAGNLDTARFKVLLSGETGISVKNIESIVLGSHGDTMVPLISRTKINGKPLTEFMDREKIDRILNESKKRGARIVSLLKMGSAFFSPSAACFEILRAIIRDEKKIIPCSCILSGEYGIDDCAIGVPAKIGADGVEKILEWKLPDNELNALRTSAEAAKNILDNNVFSDR